ncbi:hypothetical protein D0869_13518 [Hortaea werneckii]|uniref:Uncharacterized protein n=1 Tax=Hortaea werneckii TaxID=91943 RepID=A0A3M6W4Q1_HORWE|nr:hypothetical protein D0869_13518 [Hortaea werneckii]
MKLLHSCLLALCNCAAVSAWYDASVGNYFRAPSPLIVYNVSAARQNANISTPTSFTAGTPQQLWNLSVSLAEIFAQGENTTAVPDARMLLTLYDVHPPANWTGQQSSGLTRPVKYDNAALRYRFGWRLTYWPFLTSETNAYQSVSDCAGVVEPDCLRQLKASNVTTSIHTDLPACADVSSRWGRPGITKAIRRSELDRPSVWELGGFISGVYSAGNRTLIERELNRVHFAVLAGDKTHTLCLRFRDNEVNSSNPGTGSAPNSSPNPIRTGLWIAIASRVLFIFL